MPAAGAIAASLAASVTVSGVMTGLMVAGTAMTVIGKATGSKTLSKLGMGLGLAGGVGSLASSLSGGLNATTGGAAIANSADDAVESASSLTRKRNNSLFDMTKDTKVQNTKLASQSDNLKVDGGGFFSDAKDKLMKYDMAANVLGGMGQAYMDNQALEQREKMQKRELDQVERFRQEDRDNLNSFGAYTPAKKLQYNPNAKPLFQTPPVMR